MIKWFLRLTLVLAPLSASWAQSCDDGDVPETLVVCSEGTNSYNWTAWFNETGGPFATEATWTDPDGNEVALTAGSAFSPPQPVLSGDWELEVALTGGNDTCTYTVELITATSPDAAFNVVQQNICGDQGIQFDLDNVDPALDYFWTFGDGATSMQPQPTHAYFLDGGGSQNVNVTLTTTNEEGCSATASETITVLEVPNPGLGSLDPLCVPEVDSEPYPLLPSDFNPTFNPVNGITSITIDWGNGSDTVITEILPSSDGGYIGTTYSNFGYYNVTVTATAANGCASVYSDSLFVGNNPQIGAANPGNTVGLCSPFELGFPIFNFENNAPETMYLLDFGDGSSEWVTHDFLVSPDFPDSVFHSYNESSCGNEYSPNNNTTYSNALAFTIEAVNDCFSSSNTVGPITLHASPDPQLTGPSDICVDFTGHYSASDFGQVVTLNDCNPSNVEWNVQALNGQQNTSPSFGFDSIWSLSFPEPGEYNVIFNAMHTSCGTETTAMTVCVYPELQAVGQVSPLGGCAPLLVDLEDLTGDPVLCGDPTTTWTISGPGGVSWLTGGPNDVNSSIELTQPGSHIVELKVGIPNKDACPASTISWSIDVLAPPPANIDVTPIACEGENVIGEYLTFPTTFTPVDTWEWTLDGMTQGSAQSDINLGALSSGSHSLIGTASNLCGSAADQVTFNVEAAPIINFNLTAPSACAGTDVDITATGTGGATFQWTTSPYFVETPLGSLVTVNALTTTTIEVTATGANGCVSSDDLDVVYTPLPEAGVTLPAAPCPGQSVTINGTATGGTLPYSSFNWSGDLSASNQPYVDWTAPPNAVTLSSILTVEDALGCIDSIPVSLTSLNNPTVEAGDPLNLCDNGTYTTPLIGYSPGLTDGGNGVWSGAGLTGVDGFTTDGAGPSVLTYTFTDLNGCTAEDELTINVAPFIEVNPGLPTEVCQGDASFTIPGFSPATATWTGTGVATDGALDPNLTPNTYTLTLENGVGSCLSSATSTFTIHPLPTPTITAPSAVCEGDMFNVTLAEPNAPDLFWTDDPSLELTRTALAGNTPITLEGAAITAEGCEATVSATVEVNLLPTITIPDQGILCNLPIETTLTGATPAGGTWAGAGIQDGSLGTFIPFEVGTGTVNLTYTFQDANACTNTDTTTVTIDDPVEAEAGNDIAICDEDSSFALDGFTPVTGGTWSSPTVNVDAAGNVDAGPLVPDVYILNYTYGTGTCQNTDSRTLTVHDRPVISLTSSTPALCEGDDFLFTGIISGGLPPYTYTWTGATQVSSEPASATASAAALNPGTLTIALTVTDDRGCTESTTLDVTVWALPAVDAGSDLILCNQAIPEILTSFTPIGGTWSGAGIMDAELGEFLPSAAGTGSTTVTYTYLDGNGCSNSDNIDIEIQLPLVADAGPDLTLCDNDFPIELNGIPAAGSSWSATSAGSEIGLVDNTTGTVSPTNLPPGNHTFLIAYGTGTCYTSDEMEITIQTLPTVTVNGPDTFCANLGTVDLSTATPTGGTWYGTGIVDPEAGTFLSGIAPGDYAPAYWYEDPTSGCRDTVDHAVTVHPVPVASFEHDTLGCSNLDLPLTNLSTGNNSQDWDFGGLASSADFDPEYTFPGDGTYVITLQAANAFGCVDVATSSVDITHPPVADLVLTPDSGCAPVDVEFANLSDAPFGSYLWTVNGDEYNQEAPPELSFPQGDSVLNYSVSLLASNLCGSDAVSDAIFVYPTPVMVFAFEEDTVCSPFEMNIMNASVGLPDNVTWDFGDGTGYAGADPPDHWYAVDTVAQVFTVTLIGQNQCGADTTTGDVLVVPNQVEAFFTLSTPDGCAPFALTVEDFSSSTTEVSYAFDNGDFAATPVASTTYLNPGTYTVTQFVTNGCSYDTLILPVVVHPVPEVSLSVSESSGCEGSDFTFVSITDIPGNADWNWGDGNVGSGLTATHQYDTPGTFTATFATEAPLTGCSAQESIDIQVFANPVAAIAIDDGLGCAPLTVTFTNTSSGGQFQTWDFGDGSEPGFQSGPSHVFANGGTEPVQYTVTLVAESPQLCADSTSIVVTVLPTPQAAFALAGIESCTFPVDIVPENQSTGSINHSWSVNGNVPATGLQPIFTADAVGSYAVELTAANSYGCEDTAEGEFTVHLAPTANLNANPRIGCNPLSVDFQDLSSYSQSTSLFIDGIYDGPLPIEGLLIDQVGTFESHIVATSPEGCTDTLFLAEDFTVHPVPFADFTFDPLTTAPENTSFQFTNESNTAFATNWTFGDGNGSFIPDPLHRYDEPGEYTVALSVQNEFGCSDLTAELLVIDDKITVFVPNAFTPASDGIGDGINDAFKPYIRGVNLIQKYTFQIFDRWGTLIFETNDYDEYWKGDVLRSSGDNFDYFAQNDVYNWKVTLILSGEEADDLVGTSNPFCNGPRQFCGHVTLIR